MCRSLEASFNEASEFFASYELQVHVVKFVQLLLYGNDDGKNLALHNCNETSICNARCFYSTLVYCMYRVYPPCLGLLCLLHPRLDVVYFIHLHAFTFVYPIYKYLPHLHALNRYLPVFTSFTPLHAFTCSTTLPLFTYMGHTGVHLCCACI